MLKTCSIKYANVENQVQFAEVLFFAILKSGEAYVHEGRSVLNQTFVQNCKPIQKKNQEMQQNNMAIIQLGKRCTARPEHVRTFCKISFIPHNIIRFKNSQEVNENPLSEIRCHLRQSGCLV